MAQNWLPSGIAIPALATAVGVAGAALGIWLTGLRRRARVVVPFSAGVLLGVALFGLVPELAENAGWLPTVLLFAAGYGLLLTVNRYAYPVCPTCAHDHDHNACGTELHGFAGPLVAAAALHSFLDGWSVAAVQHGVTLGLQVAVPLAVALHKLPEGIALGGILSASLKSRSMTLAWCAVAEGTTLAGGAFGLLSRRTWAACGPPTPWDSPPAGCSTWASTPCTKNGSAAAPAPRLSQPWAVWPQRLCFSAAPKRYSGRNSTLS